MPSYLVTGASRGIGYAWLQHLAADASNTVFALVRNKPATEEKLARDNITGVHVLAADITDNEAVKRVAAEVSDMTNGSLDILIHNAAAISDRSGFITVLDDTPEDLARDLNDGFQANVIGTAYILYAFLPLIRTGHAKKIMVNSTGMADLDLVREFHVGTGTPYSVTKAAANLLVTKFHAVLGEAEGILVFSMSPGLVNTLQRALSEEEMKGLGAMMQKFAAYAPHFKGPITAEESVRMQLSVIQRATVKEFGGAFVSHFGDKQWL